MFRPSNPSQRHTYASEAIWKVFTSSDNRQGFLSQLIKILGEHFNSPFAVLAIESSIRNCASKGRAILACLGQRFSHQCASKKRHHDRCDRRAIQTGEPRIGGSKIRAAIVDSAAHHPIEVEARNRFTDLGANLFAIGECAKTTIAFGIADRTFEAFGGYFGRVHSATGKPKKREIRPSGRTTRNSLPWPMDCSRHVIIELDDEYVRKLERPIKIGMSSMVQLQSEPETLGLILIRRGARLVNQIRQAGN